MFNTLRCVFNTFRWNWGIPIVFSIRFVECLIQHNVFSVQFIECSIQHVEYSIKHDEYSIQFIVSSIHSVECSIRFLRVFMNLHRKMIFFFELSEKWVLLIRIVVLSNNELWKKSNELSISFVKYQHRIISKSRHFLYQVHMK